MHLPGRKSFRDLNKRNVGVSCLFTSQNAVQIEHTLSEWNYFADLCCLFEWFEYNRENCPPMSLHSRHFSRQQSAQSDVGDRARKQCIAPGCVRWATRLETEWGPPPSTTRTLTAANSRKRGSDSTIGWPTARSSALRETNCSTRLRNGNRSRLRASPLQGTSHLDWSHIEKWTWLHTNEFKHLNSSLRIFLNG
jgi:hypothetical protein